MTMTPFTPVLRSWEEHFTVVQWDRRGAGKTLARNGKTASGQLTFDLMAADGIEVAEYRADRVLRDLHGGDARRPRRAVGHALVGVAQIDDSADAVRPCRRPPSLAQAPRRLHTDHRTRPDLPQPAQITYIDAAVPRKLPAI